ncbi:hypothetical protein D9M70_352590 [compost metagenome]
MTWLRLVPAWCWWLLALVLVGGGQQLRVSLAQADAAQALSFLADYMLLISERDRRAEAKARTEEQRRQQAVDEVEKDAKGKLDEARADAATAQSAADRLRVEVDRLRAGRSATCSAIAAQQRQAGESAVVVLAELLESADRMAGDLAAALDRSRVAGLACEAAYEGVRGGG